MIESADSSEHWSLRLAKYLYFLGYVLLSLLILSLAGWAAACVGVGVLGFAIEVSSFLFFFYGSALWLGLFLIAAVRRRGRLWLGLWLQAICLLGLVLLAIYWFSTHPIDL